jgi:membrane protein implicated in regulation of membrane protease activity
MDSLAVLIFTLGPFHWLALSAALIGIEMMLPTQYLIWPGIAAAAVGLLTFVIAPDWPIQVAVFGALSAILAVASHRLPSLERAQGSPLNQRTDQLVGSRAVVAGDFQHGRGAVTVGDTSWPAQSVDGKDYPAGTDVEIVATESTLLKVRRVPA